MLTKVVILRKSWKFAKINKRQFHASSTLQTHLWVRDEFKSDERRCILVPNDAKQLLSSGVKVTVESSQLRIFKDSEYESVGCEMVPSSSWIEAPADAIICGLKELPLPSQVPSIPFELRHKHIMFGHSYKFQENWKTNLSRFTMGGGELYDLEYLTYDNGKRVAAFGHQAGFAGMSLGLLLWAHNTFFGRLKPFPSIKPYEAKSELVADIQESFQKITVRPEVIIVGRGHCGSGAAECLEALGLKKTVWSSQDTKSGGPFIEMTKYDILVNSIFLSEKSSRQLFVDESTLKQAEQQKIRKLSVLVDVSCDVSNPKNPLPISNQLTTFKQPVRRIYPTGSQETPLDIIAIDHLPSLIPRESSIEFSKSLLPYLLALKDFDPSRQKAKETKEVERVWERTRNLYLSKIKDL